MKRGFLLAFVLALVAGTAGADFIRYHPPQFSVTSGGSAFFANGISLGNTNASPYANLYGDAANTLALRNGGTAGASVPQSFFVYNFCDGAACATGYERLTLAWGITANTISIFGQQGGTGSSRNLQIGTTGAGELQFFSNNSRKWTLVSGGSLQPETNDAVSLGADSKQASSLYVARSTQGSKSKSLTDAAAATAFATIAVPTNGQIAGELIWTATSSAAAVRFVANGSIRFWGVDEGGTPVCGINAIGTAGEGHSSGANTLVCTWTNVVATTNCAISVTCTNDTAGVDPITVNGRFNMPTTATITFN